MGSYEIKVNILQWQTRACVTKLANQLKVETCLSVAHHERKLDYIEAT